MIPTDLTELHAEEFRLKRRQKLLTILAKSEPVWPEHVRQELEAASASGGVDGAGGVSGLPLDILDLLVKDIIRHSALNGLDEKWHNAPTKEELQKQTAKVLQENLAGTHAARQARLAELRARNGIGDTCHRLAHDDVDWSVRGVKPQ